MRKHPEPLPPGGNPWTNEIGTIPLVIIVTVACLSLCCATTCFCVAGGVKGAYDDLSELTRSANAETRPSANAGTQPLVQEEPPADQTEEDVQNATREEQTDVQNDADNANEETQALIDTEEGHAAEHYVRLIDVEDNLLSSSGRRPRRSHMQRLYNTCVVCYLLTITCIALLTAAAFRYFPQKPLYNVCNDSVAWKSIIDSMASAKASVDFELLFSVQNLNHFDIAVDMGKGSFYHDGAFVGTYEIPPVTVAQSAITDILVVAHFAPEKWEALSLTSEYYRGKLVLSVNAQATVRMPGLLNYTFTAQLKDITVHVNEMSDRHLCACPTWSDAKNNTPPVELY
jgi:hypothetical protein